MAKRKAFEETRFGAELAKNMKQARLATWGPHPTACADALGIQRSQILRWETGEHVPGLWDLSRFARVCNTTVADLIGGSRAPAAAQLLLGLEPDAQAAIVDLVEIIKAKTEEASRLRGARRRRAR